MKRIRNIAIVIIAILLIFSTAFAVIKRMTQTPEITQYSVVEVVEREGELAEEADEILWNVLHPKESYQYDLDLVEDNQVVFAYRFTYSDWGDVDELLIVNKNNQCKVINLLNEKCPDNQDPKILEFFDSLMQDDTYPYGKYNSDFTKEEFKAFINMPNLTFEEGTGNGLGDIVFFYVAGNQENRKIEMMKVEGYVSLIPQSNRKKVNEICDRLERIACENSK